MAHHNHVGLSLTVGDGVLCEDEEVAERHEVRHEQTRPGMLEIVAETCINFHPDGASHSLPEMGMREEDREERREQNRRGGQRIGGKRRTEKRP